MSEQPGNRIPAIPSIKPQKPTEVEQNPITYDNNEGGVISTDPSKGGAPEWESHPNPQDVFKIDTLNPKKAR